MGSFKVIDDSQDCSFIILAAVAPPMATEHHPTGDGNIRQNPPCAAVGTAVNSPHSCESQRPSCTSTWTKTLQQVLNVWAWKFRNSCTAATATPRALPGPDGPHPESAADPRRDSGYQTNLYFTLTPFPAFKFVHTKLSVIILHLPVSLKYSLKQHFPITITNFITHGQHHEWSRTFAHNKHILTLLQDQIFT